MKLTFLGTGTSQGVPVIGCRCAVCRSQDARDNRLRTSAMVEKGSTRIVIDAGPDFRCQMLRTGVSRIDAILLTHEHRDHIAGLDDVRAFNYVDYPMIRHIALHATPHVLECVRHDFGYAFEPEGYRGVPRLELHPIEVDRPFRIGEMEILPVAGHHSDRFEVTGFRIGQLGYLTDFKTIEEREIKKLEGVDTLVVNALRFQPHDSHFHVAEALDLAARIGANRTYLTHMSHEIGLHARIADRLPQGVLPAYDGLEVEIGTPQPNPNEA